MLRLFFCPSHTWRRARKYGLPSADRRGTRRYGVPALLLLLGEDEEFFAGPVAGGVFDAFPEEEAEVLFKEFADLPLSAAVGWSAH